MNEPHYTRKKKLARHPKFWHCIAGLILSTALPIYRTKMIKFSPYSERCQFHISTPYIHLKTICISLENGGKNQDSGCLPPDFKFKPHMSEIEEMHT